MACHHRNQFTGIATSSSKDQTWIVLDPNCGHCRNMLDDMLYNGPVDKKYKVYVLTGPDDPMMGLCTGTEFPHCFNCSAGSKPALENYTKIDKAEGWWKAKQPHPYLYPN